MESSDKTKQRQLREQMIIAREIGRGIFPPEFAGYQIKLYGPRINLWWLGGFQPRRCFSDAFIFDNERLLLVIADVTDSIDATGLALSVRGFLRGCFAQESTVANAILSLESWYKTEQYWSGMCSLGIAIVKKSREVEFAGIGAIECFHRSGTHLNETEVVVKSLPLFVGAYSEEDKIQESIEIRKLQLNQGDVFSIQTIDEREEHYEPFDEGFAKATVAVV